MIKDNGNNFLLSGPFPRFKYSYFNISKRVRCQERGAYQ